MLHFEKQITAVILDLDGVITQTASIHTEAWKQMFDNYLEKRSYSTGKPFRPLDPVFDYKEYIDGRPRYEGARGFLHSRKIEIPWGSPQDNIETETICGLGNRKNQIYLKLLEQKGAQAFSDALQMLNQWKKDGLRLAVISASKNCRQVLHSVNLISMFDAIVDGNDAVTHNLKGKPQPDVFIYAAKLLGVKEENAAVIEDAPAGIDAGKKGNFSLVAGVDRKNEGTSVLWKHHADLVISDLTQLQNLPYLAKRDIRSIPSALKEFDSISREIQPENIFLLFDYDGTLTPIVDRPENALLSPQMRSVLEKLSHLTTIGIISGRDRLDVENMVSLEYLYYAGSHGFDIAGPDGINMQVEAAKESEKVLDQIEQKVPQILKEYQGARIERKKFALAIHYRAVKSDVTAPLQAALLKLASKYPEVTLTRGKKIFEFRPAPGWDKGKAVSWLSGTIFPGKKIVQFYFGDDITDEDAFRELAATGVSILVGDHGQKSFAKYHLENVNEVYTFLDTLSKRSGLSPQ